MAKKVLRRVKKVIDGDTLIVSNPVRGSRYVRLAGINTPEKRQKGYPVAKANLKSRVGGKRIWVTPVGKSYGRVVAKIRNVRIDKR